MAKHGKSHKQTLERRRQQGITKTSEGKYLSEAATKLANAKKAAKAAKEAQPAKSPPNTQRRPTLKSVVGRVLGRKMHREKPEESAPKRRQKTPPSSLGESSDTAPTSEDESSASEDTGPRPIQPGVPIAKSGSRSLLNAALELQLLKNKNRSKSTIQTLPKGTHNKRNITDGNRWTGRRGHTLSKGPRKSSPSRRGGRDHNLEEPARAAARTRSLHEQRKSSRPVPGEKRKSPEQQAPVHGHTTAKIQKRVRISNPHDADESGSTEPSDEDRCFKRGQSTASISDKMRNLHRSEQRIHGTQKRSTSTKIKGHRRGITTGRLTMGMLSHAFQYWAAEGEHPRAYTTADIIALKKSGQWNLLRPSLVSIKTGRDNLPSNPVVPILKAVQLRAAGIIQYVEKTKNLHVAPTDIFIPTVKPASELFNKYANSNVSTVVDEYFVDRVQGEPDLTREEAIDELFPAGLPDLWSPYKLPKYSQPADNIQYDGRSWRAVVDYLQYAEQTSNEPLANNLKHCLLKLKEAATTTFIGNGSIQGALGRMEYAGEVHAEAMQLKRPSRSTYNQLLSKYFPVRELPKEFEFNFDPIRWLTTDEIRYATIRNGEPSVGIFKGPRTNTVADAGFPYHDSKRGETSEADVLVFSKMMGDLRRALAGHITMKGFDERFQFRDVSKDKRKKEIYKNIKLNNKTRLITVMSASTTLGWLYTVQLMGMNKQNIRNQPDCRSLFGFNFLTGGMDFYLRYLNKCTKEDGYAVSYYADNAFIFFREGKKARYISIDGNAQEASNDPEQARWWTNYIISSLTGNGLDKKGRVNLNKRLSPEWAAYLTELGPECICGGTSVLSSIQFVHDYLNSGHPTTAVANFCCMAPNIGAVESKLTKEKHQTLDTWVVNKNGNLEPSEVCKKVFHYNRVLPKIGAVGMDETSIDSARNNPLQLLQESKGYKKARLDTLGWDAVYVEIKNSGGTHLKAAAVLDTARLYPSIILRKTDLRKVENDLERVAMEISIYSALYIIGGWLPETAPTMKAIMVALQGEFISLGGHAAMRAHYIEKSAEEAFAALRALGVGEEMLTQLSGDMAETLTKGIPTMECVLKIVCGKDFAAEFRKAVDEQVDPEERFLLLTDKEADSDEYRPQMRQGDKTARVKATSEIKAKVPPLSQELSVGQTRIQKKTTGGIPSAQRYPRKGKPGSGGGSLDVVSRRLEHALKSGQIFEITPPITSPAEQAKIDNMGRVERETLQTSLYLSWKYGVRAKDVMTVLRTLVRKLVLNDQIKIIKRLEIVEKH